MARSRLSFAPFKPFMRPIAGKGHRNGIYLIRFATALVFSKLIYNESQPTQSKLNYQTRMPLSIRYTLHQGQSQRQSLKSHIKNLLTN